MSITVAVLRGGPSSEYEVSLKTGSAMLRNLPEKYRPLDILIDQQGVWHRAGVPEEPAIALTGVDVVLNALHGEYGEDGGVQRLLECLHIPYTGSESFASAVAMNKPLSKEYFKRSGLKVARHRVLEVSENLDGELVSIFRSFHLPLVVKPSSAGSSVGVSIANSFSKLKEAVARAFSYGPKIMVEEYVRGREATCGVVENFRGQKLYALFPIEIISENEFFDYDAKYRGRSREICPSTFSQEEKRKIEQVALEAHRALGLRHYSRTDMIITPRDIYILESNTLPGMTEESLVPKALRAGGIEFSEFLDHLVTLALSER